MGRDTFSGFGSAVIAHGINSWAITRVNGVLPTVYSGVQVAFTVLFGLTFLDEKLEAIQFGRDRHHRRRGVLRREKSRGRTGGGNAAFVVVVDVNCRPSGRR